MQEAALPCVNLGPQHPKFDGLTRFSTKPLLSHLAGGGPALQALLYILGPGFADLTSVRTQVDIVTSREAAVLAALRVLHTALTMDLDFVSDLSRVNMHDRWGGTCTTLTASRLCLCFHQYIYDPFMRTNLKRVGVILKLVKVYDSC